MIEWILGLFVALAGMVVWHVYRWTTNEAVALARLEGHGLYARALLLEINGEESVQARLAAWQGQEFCRDFNLAMLPMLVADMSLLSREVGIVLRPLALGLFYAVYALTWTKIKLHAGRGDLRGLIGVQVLFLR